MMFTNKLRSLLLGTALAGMSLTTLAAPVSPTTVTQGQACNTAASCIAVAADRSNIDSINAVGGQFFSLGAGGFIEFAINPYFFGTPVLTIETTNGPANSANSGFPESANFIFSGSGSTVTIGLNNQNNVVATSDALLAMGSRIGNGANQGGSWQIELLFGGFDTLRIVDTTLANYAFAYASNRTDGFDIDFIDFNRVPEPASLGLMGLGLLGLLAATRRRKLRR